MHSSLIRIPQRERLQITYLLLTYLAVARRGILKVRGLIADWRANAPSHAVAEPSSSGRFILRTCGDSDTLTLLSGSATDLQNIFRLCDSLMTDSLIC